jgi:hypothetical protein
LEKSESEGLFSSCSVSVWSLLPKMLRTKSCLWVCLCIDDVEEDTGVNDCTEVAAEKRHKVVAAMAALVLRLRRLANCVLGMFMFVFVFMFMIVVVVFI